MVPLLPPGVVEAGRVETPRFPPEALQTPRYEWHTQRFCFCLDFSIILMFGGIGL